MNTSLEIQLRRAALPLTTICILAFAAAALSLHARENEVEHQEIERSVRLMRTDPAPSNAVGTAQLEVGHRSASRSNRIEIHTSGLVAGTYTVTVFDRSGANIALMRSFVAGASDDDSGDDSGHGRGRGRGGRDRFDDAQDSQRRGGADDDGEAKFAVPDSINAFDLGRISITDGS